MNLKPAIMDKLQCKYTIYTFDLEFKTNLTMLTSKSGIGKSFLYQAIQNHKLIDSKSHIMCFNYVNVHDDDLTNKIKKAKKKLIVIDNADLMLTEELKEHIAFDHDNQYLIIGRLLEGLLLTKDNICSLNYDRENKHFKFKYK